MMFFYFLKIIFDISTSKRSKKYKPHSILAKKKKKFKFSQNTGRNALPNAPNIFLAMSNMYFYDRSRGIMWILVLLFIVSSCLILRMYFLLGMLLPNNGIFGWEAWARYLNHAQEPRTYTNKIEKASNTHCHLLIESKTTLFYQNQSQTYCFDT